jgi:Peptidase family C25
MTTSVKLSVTVRSALEGKYRVVDLKKIDAAVKAWIRAEEQRGIHTVHVALDVEADMTVHGLKALSLPITANAAKKAIDELSAKLLPDYVVLLGGDDIIPYFRLTNPIFDPSPDGDPDQIVLSDNPYATSRPYVANASKSYLVPDRVVGRIPDVPSAKGKGNPATILATLGTATKWQPRPLAFFGEIYATSTATWQKAGRAMMSYLGFPLTDLMIAPPTMDASVVARKRLSRPVHMTKCHGADPDARFFGESIRGDFPPILFSNTLAQRVEHGTLVAAVCCYGAGIFAPDSPLAQPRGSNALPIAVAYLHSGALAFMGSTEIAYVGSDEPLCGDLIVASYLKKALGGASLGRAMLEAKQDFLAAIQRQGRTPDTADEKTMIEFVLLGDPAIHPIASTVPRPARFGPEAEERRAKLRAGRRAARVVVATEVESVLPARTKATPPTPIEARAIFEAAASLLAEVDFSAFDRAVASVELVVPPPYDASAPRMARRVMAAVARSAPDETREFTWWGRLSPEAIGRRRGARGENGLSAGGPIGRVVMKAQTDAQGNVLRARTLHAA